MSVSAGRAEATSMTGVSAGLATIGIQTRTETQTETPTVIPTATAAGATAIVTIVSTATATDGATLTAVDAKTAWIATATGVAMR